MIIKKIRFADYSFRGSYDKITAGYQQLTDGINEWYEKNQDVEIVSVNVDHEQVTQARLSVVFTARICYIEEHVV